MALRLRGHGPRGGHRRAPPDRRPAARPPPQPTRPKPPGRPSTSPRNFAPPASRSRYSKVEATRHTYEAAAAARRRRAGASRSARARRPVLGGGRPARHPGAGKLAGAHDTRRQWEAMTEPTRRLAPGRRHRAQAPRRPRPRRPTPVRRARRIQIRGARARPADVWVQPRLDGSTDLPREPEPEPLSRGRARGTGAAGPRPHPRLRPARTTPAGHRNRRVQPPAASRDRRTPLHAHPLRRPGRDRPWRSVERPGRTPPRRRHPAPQAAHPRRRGRA